MSSNSPPNADLKYYVINNKQLFFCSIFLFMLIGVGYIVLRTPHYRASMVLPVKNVIPGLTADTNNDNIISPQYIMQQIHLLTSKKIVVPVVEKLGLQVRYYDDQWSSGTELFGDQCPEKVDLIKSGSKAELVFTLQAKTNGMINIGFDGSNYVFKYNETIKIFGYEFIITKNKEFYGPPKRMRVKLSNLNAAADELINSMGAQPAASDSTSIDFTFTSTNPLKADTFCKELTLQYLAISINGFRVNEKIANIDHQLDSIKSILKTTSKKKSHTSKTTLTRQSDVNLYFYLFQKREDLKNSLSVFRKSYEISKINIVRVDNDPFVILLISLIAGFTIPFVFLVASDKLKI